jgi:CheY-like chemotaxis protein
MMPQMTGIDLAIRIRLITPECKVLLFSGQAETADLLKKAQGDRHDFVLLAKPMHPSDLLSALRAL